MAKKSKNKFETLIHSGVTFPAEYEFKDLVVNGVHLTPLSEEMIATCSRYLETDYYKNPTFHENFWKCLKPELPTELQNLNWPVDFEPLMKSIKATNDYEKEFKKANTTKEDREKAKKEKEVLKKTFGIAILDGKKQTLGAYQVEPPGIMIARGKSPLLGLWKYRTEPEDIVINWCPCDSDEWKALTPELQNYYYGLINIDDSSLTKADKDFIENRPDMEVAPLPPEGHKWKEVTSDRNAFLIAKYKVNYGGVVNWWKKMMFGATSSVKTNADQKKFEKALKLIKDWDKMEAHISKGLKSKDAKTMESALIAYLIKTTSIRVGNEKEDIVDNQTVGASTLLVKNIKLSKEA